MMFHRIIVINFSLILFLLFFFNFYYNLPSSLLVLQFLAKTDFVAEYMIIFHYICRFLLLALR